MTIRPLNDSDREAYNTVVTHPLQSWEWGEFREKEDIKVIRRGVFDGEKLVDGFQLTIHKLPKLSYTLGYLPKGHLPTKEVIEELRKIGRDENCIHIQLEPNVLRHSETQSKNPMGSFANAQDDELKKLGLHPAVHPLFTKHTFVIDLTKSEDELLKNMHSKARYNIRVAQRHRVEVLEDNSDKAFDRYWELTEETTTRQQFYAHTKHYHKLQWQTLRSQNSDGKTQNFNQLTSHLLTAVYDESRDTEDQRPKTKDSKSKILTAWIVFVFHDALYYPYGASSDEHRETMHSTLMMWEAMRFGKNLGLKKFDLWGAAAPDTPPTDPWYGFTNFKQRFGPERVEFVGSYDLVIRPSMYQLFKLADKLRWFYLKLKK